MPLRTLYGRLVLALLVLFTLTGIAYVTLTVVTTRLHLQEVTQTLHRPIAANIVTEQWLMRGDAINKPALKDIFTRLMHINPSIEVYLLDSEGRILSYSAAPEAVKRARVSLDPVVSFLSDQDGRPLRGDDPRSPTGRKIFSAAPIYDSGKMAGFLYIVLGGQEYDSVVALFQRSHVFRLSAGMTIAGVLLTIALGALSFNWLTRRLRLLSAHLETFRRAGFTRPLELPRWRRDGKGDEIDRLGLTIEAMSARISGQIVQLSKADTDRRDMVAAISHDLRTPLASLRGYLETLHMKGGTLSDEEKRCYLALALEHGERLSRLIDNLFELATLEASDAQLRREPFPINELAADLMQRFGLKAESRQLRLVSDIPEKAPFVSGDIALIERVLENLIENAINYTPSGGTVRLRLEATKTGVSVTVADTGPGIEPDHLPHIFDRFFQAGRPHRNPNKGAGLGLAIARRILQLHDSAITVDSTPGAGASFSFELAAASS
jgi:signal transduction histidine kinase